VDGREAVELLVAEHVRVDPRGEVRAPVAKLRAHDREGYALGERDRAGAVPQAVKVSDVPALRVHEARASAELAMRCEIEEGLSGPPSRPG
jgi:hypothetical protein